MSKRVYVISDINPEPWTAPSVSVGRKGGKVFPRVYQSAALRSYKNAVRDDLTEQASEDPFDGHISLAFFFWRQLPDYETDRERRARKHEADVTNLQKALEDSLQGVLFTNDRNVIGIESYLMEQGHGTRPTIMVVMDTSPRLPMEVYDDLPDEVKTETVKVLDHDREAMNVRDIF